MNEQEAIAHFTQATRDCLAKAAILYPNIANELAITEIKFDIRSGAVGEAMYSKMNGLILIRYNLAAAILNPVVFADTVPHEVAHIVCFLLENDLGHGFIWRETCRVLGGNGQRVCHASDFPELPRITRGTRYYRWENSKNGRGRWVSKKDHMRLKDYEWARKYFSLDTLTDEKVMSKDELWAADLTDRKARLAAHDAAIAAEAGLAKALEDLTHLKAA